MYVNPAYSLFAWQCLEDTPSLRTLRTFLELLPDQELLAALTAARGKGRDDYPVRVLWAAVVLTPALRVTTTAACLAELRRNPALRLLIGIPDEAGVPHDYNVTRFLSVLGRPAHLALLATMFATLVHRLGQAVPDLGVHCAGDATALRVRRDRATPEPGLPQPSGGRKEYVDAAGHVTSAYEWFGYKLHLVVDVKHEVPLAYAVTAPSAGDGATLPATLDAARAALPPGRIQTLAFDKAADTVDVHQALYARGIKPVIQMRELWHTELQRPVPGEQSWPVKLTYDECGTVHCWDDSQTPAVCRPMHYFGHEAARDCLKYRCPALHEGLACGCEQRCNRGKVWGLTVRVPCATDRRRFPPLPRATQTFERLYRQRTANERVNMRAKLYWGIDDGNVTGAARAHAQAGVVMVVQLGFATLLARAPRRGKTLGHVGLGPVQEILERATRRA